MAHYSKPAISYVKHIGEWIYFFRNLPTSKHKIFREKSCNCGELFRIKEDGTGIQSLLEGPIHCEDFSIVDVISNQIFYCVKEISNFDGKIHKCPYKCNLDGSQRENDRFNPIFTEGYTRTQSLHLSVRDKFICILNPDNTEKLLFELKMHKKSRHTTHIGSIFESDGYLYFDTTYTTHYPIHNYRPIHKIMRVHIKTGRVHKLHDFRYELNYRERPEVPDFFNLWFNKILGIEKGWIYFSFTNTANLFIYRTKVDGGDLEYVQKSVKDADFHIDQSNMEMIDNIIYYARINNGIRKFYKMDLSLQYEEELNSSLDLSQNPRYTVGDKNEYYLKKGVFYSVFCPVGQDSTITMLNVKEDSVKTIYLTRL